jgi:hypothetical protein
MEEVVLLYASNRRLEGWVSFEVGGPVEFSKWRSASTLEAAPMWVSPTQHSHGNAFGHRNAVWTYRMDLKPCSIDIHVA